MDRMRLSLANLKELEARITKANAEGQTALAETLMQEYTIKKTQHMKVTQALTQQFIAARQAIQAQSGLSQDQGLCHFAWLLDCFSHLFSRCSISSKRTCCSSVRPKQWNWPLVYRESVFVLHCICKLGCDANAAFSFIERNHFPLRYNTFHYIDRCNSYFNADAKISGAANVKTNDYRHDGQYFPSEHISSP